MNIKVTFYNNNCCKLQVIIIMKNVDKDFNVHQSFNHCMLNEHKFDNLLVCGESRVPSTDANLGFSSSI